MKNQKPLYQLAFDVLKDEHEKKDRFLNNKKISVLMPVIAYNNGYEMEETVTEKQVSRFMGKVRKYAISVGKIIVADRKETAKDPTKKYRVRGWKIAGKEDTKYLEQEQRIRIDLSNGNLHQVKNMLKVAQETKIITNDSMFKLPNL